FVLYEEHQEFCWLGTACVPTDDMHVVGSLVVRLPRSQFHFLSALDLHHDGTFQDVDEPMRIVPVDWIGSAGGIFHDKHQSLLARALLEVLRKEGCDFGFLSNSGVDHQTCQNQQQYFAFHK